MLELRPTCENCGGGFCPRSIRPVTNWSGDNFLGAYPASTTIRRRSAFSVLVPSHLVRCYWWFDEPVPDGPRSITTR
jgi:hypothetical protein